MFFPTQDRTLCFFPSSVLPALTNQLARNAYAKTQLHHCPQGWNRSNGVLPALRRSAPSIAGLSRSDVQAEPTGLGGGEAAGIAAAIHSGRSCCSMYCLITDRGAPPHEATK